MAEKVDQDVLETFEEVIEQMPLSVPQHVIMNALASMKEAGRKQGLREAAEVALSHMTCGCNGKHGYCGADSQPKAIATAIAALMEGEGK